MPTTRAWRARNSSGILLCSRLPDRRRSRGEWAPGHGSAQPIAPATARRAALDAVTASWTIKCQEDARPAQAGFRKALTDLRELSSAGTARAGLPKAEPGAGSAGRGAAQRRRLDASDDDLRQGRAALAKIHKIA